MMPLAPDSADPNDAPYSIAKSLATFGDAEFQLANPELIAEAVILRRKHQIVFALLPIILAVGAALIWLTRGG